MAARKGKRLTFLRLLALARAVAAAHGLSMPSAHRLRLRHSERVPIPTVTTNAQGTLWIDRDYIAYALADELVRYVYVTRTHAKEEIASYAMLRKLRANPPRLPPEILNQFRTALRMMNLRDAHSYLFREVGGLMPEWVTAKKSSGKSTSRVK